MNYTPIQTNEVKLPSGTSLWEATTKIGVLPCKVINHNKDEAIRIMKAQVAQHCGLKSSEVAVQ